MMNKKPTIVKVETVTVFKSPTWGDLSYDQVVAKIGDYIRAQEARYRIIVGTDSAPRNEGYAEYITALIVHRVGLGGVYFWQKTTTPPAKSLRARIYKEALLSIDFAKILVDKLVAVNLLDLDLEIHVDVGKVGQTREIITEVVGMVRGNGFAVKTKPESFGASKVADRHT